ncbi:cell wall hydrolase [Clostridium botulinum]|uniref:cell wall hydrolase n=1 Tax=Clostridium botulinum TaxID=1491 RepID=UPI000A16ED61|nr:cell wall hydrolase [Clostridium botulinum]OSA81681.1 peptidoglycan-binding protein [Clostridium botulinum]
MTKHKSLKTLLATLTFCVGLSSPVFAADYRVSSGDSLYKIGQLFNVSSDTIIKNNNLKESTIYPGQVLNLPGKTSSNTSPAPAPTTPKPIVNYTESDLDLLARLITAEAQSEPYSAQVAVASVVINRIKSSQFPNSISSVIYQKSDGYYQFTPVLNGWINKPATETSKKAAKEALYGSDPSKGALYYFDNTATNKWLWSKPITARIGNMVYVK